MFYECSVYGLVTAAAAAELRTALMALCADQRSIQAFEYDETLMQSDRGQVLRLRKARFGDLQGQPKYTVIDEIIKRDQSELRATVRTVNSMEMLGENATRFLQVAGYKILYEVKRKGVSYSLASGITVTVGEVQRQTPPGAQQPARHFEAQLAEASVLCTETQVSERVSHLIAHTQGLPLKFYAERP
eukprot:m51a1_g11753 hypothetical protein (188) ;mRNA; r:199080-199761